MGDAGAPYKCVPLSDGRLSLRIQKSVLNSPHRYVFVAGTAAINLITSGIRGERNAVRPSICFSRPFS